ncbi:MAG: OmpA family protein, partial [Verrucomicrobia bacterium]|nr:OmpA family protein [Verrucomicrobiota bacterium]
VIILPLAQWPKDSRSRSTRIGAGKLQRPATAGNAVPPSTLLPLPAGEGRGEGEQAAEYAEVPPPNASEHASTTESGAKPWTLSARFLTPGPGREAEMKSGVLDRAVAGTFRRDAGSWPLALAGVWALIASVLTSRLLRAGFGLRRLKRLSSSAPAGHQERFERCAKMFACRRAVELRISAEVRGPMAVGLRRPVVLVPEQLLPRLSMGEFEQICLHELAHLRRWDDWTQLAQHAIGALYFYHPAVLWISRRLQWEREVACDDWVVSTTGESKPYALCLTKLVELTKLSERLALAPGAWIAKSQLARRISMLLDRRRDASVRTSKLACGLALVLLVGALAGSFRLSPLIAIAQDSSLPQMAESPVIQALNKELALAEARLDEIKIRYTAEHPEYRAAEAKIKSLRAARENQAKTLIEALRLKASMTDSGAQVLSRLAADLEEQGARLDQLRKEQEILKREVADKALLYKAVLAKLEKKTAEFDERRDAGAAQGPVVSISATGQLYFRDKSVTETELKNQLNAAFSATNSPGFLTLVPDPATPMESLIRVLNLAKESGASTRLPVITAGANAENGAARRINEDLLKVFLQNEEYRGHRSLFMEITPDGLVISFLDLESHPFFEAGSAAFTPYGQWVFDTVAWEIARYPSAQIELEGHTEKNFKPVRDGSGSWELSSDWAHTARRRLLQNGVRESQILKVTGYGGTKPLKDRKPEDRSNRRVSLLIRGMVERSLQTAAVLGEVAKTGVVTLRGEQTVDIIEAIAEAGGFTANANKNRIQLTRRGLTTTYKFDELRKITDPAKRVWLSPGDIVYVPERIF